MIINFIKTVFKSVLEWSALVLSIVNGLFLIFYYLRDKPKLVVSTIYPETYQWFFELPGRLYQGQETRKFGFLAYISIVNRGIRDVSLDTWYLRLMSVGGKWINANPINIPEPQIELGKSGHRKQYSVLGQGEGATMVKAGDSIDGFAYYITEFFGREIWNSLIIKEKAEGRIVIKDVFGKKNMTKIFFKKIPLDYAKKMINNIDLIDLPEDECFDISKIC